VKEQSAQERGSEALQLPEVHPGGTEDHIDPASFGSLQAVMVHPMITLQMADARLDRRTAHHPAPDTSRRSATTSLVDMNLDISCVSVTTIPHVN